MTQKTEKAQFVVAVDGSPYAQEAFSYALRAASPNDEIGVVHVLSPTDTIDLVEGSRYLPISSIQIEHGAALLDTYMEQCKRAERSCHSVLSMTPASGGAMTGRAVIEAAEQQRAQVLIVGTRGNSGIKGWLLGSVSKYLMSTSPTPATVVVRSVAMQRPRVPSTLPPGYIVPLGTPSGPAFPV